MWSGRLTASVRLYDLPAASALKLSNVPSTRNWELGWPACWITTSSCQVPAAGAGAHVLHGPAHLDRAPFLGGGRGADVGDGEVGRRREIDRERGRDRDVVGAVAVDELERRVAARPR